MPGRADYKIVLVETQLERTASEAMNRCPSCNSPAPHLHPAVQHEGEVQLCGDSFHEIITAQNTVERRSQVAKLAATTAAGEP
jgi:hypothetical protein